MSAAATPADVLAGTARWCVVEGDCLAVLATLPDACIDAVVTDPPYSSGGAFRSDRAKSTASKYTQGGATVRQNFSGDTLDQRVWMTWCVEWLEHVMRASTASGRLCAFIDWRQLPALTDCVQRAGWIWRGIVPWDKGEGSRMLPDGFRTQCEYIVWASTGPLPVPHPGVLAHPGCFHFPVLQSDKHHQTGKPTPLMREVVKIAKPGGVILDPFAGSGTTGVAALMEGRRVILCERVPEYAAITRARLAAAEAGTDWRAPASQPSLFAAVGS